MYYYVPFFWMWICSYLILFPSNPAVTAVRGRPSHQKLFILFAQTIGVSRGCVSHLSQPSCRSCRHVRRVWTSRLCSVWRWWGIFWQRQRCWVTNTNLGLETTICPSPLSPLLSLHPALNASHPGEDFQRYGSDASCWSLQGSCPRLACFGFVLLGECTLLLHKHCQQQRNWVWGNAGSGLQPRSNSAGCR